jgi:hypothetical protein
LIPLVPPPADDPLTVAPLVVPDADAAEENVEVDDSDDVGTLSGSDPMAVFPPAVVCAAVWAWAAVMPRIMIAVRIVRGIAFSCVGKRSRSCLLLAMQDNARSVKTENEV